MSWEGGRAKLYEVREEHSFWEATAELGVPPKELDEATLSLRYRLERAPGYLTYPVPGTQYRLAFTDAPGGLTYRVIFWMEIETVVLTSIADVSDPPPLPPWFR